MRGLVAAVGLLLAVLVPQCAAIQDCMNGGTFNATTDSCDCPPSFQGPQCMTLITYEFTYCNFATSITVLEGCNVEICIETFSTLPSDQSVTLVPSSGNYSISEDPYVLPLLAGTTRTVWTINTTANLVTEGTRYFTVAINSSSPALTMSTGSPTIVVYINEDISVLGPPNFITTSPSSSTKISLEWEPPAAAAMCSSSVIQRYQVDYVEDGETVSFTSSNTMLDFEDLQAFTSYTFKVAVSHSPLNTGPQDTITLRTLLPAPEMTAFDVNATYLKIEWRATTFANRYRVELTSDGFNNTSTTTNLLATFTLQPKTMYRVRVWAVDSLSPPRLGDVSETLFGTPASAPSVPLNVVSGAAFPVWTLTWQPPSVVGDDFVSYRITLERMCLSPLPAVVTNDTSYMISMLQEGIHYTLILEAFNSAGPSPELKYTFFQSRRTMPVLFEFSQTMYTVTRGQPAELAITTSETLTFNASVPLMATGGNATAGEDYTVANPLVVPLEICTNRTLFEIPTIYEVELVERTNEYFNVQVLEFDTGLETVTTSVTVVIVEPTGGPTRLAFAAESVSVYEGETAVVTMIASDLVTGDIAVFLLSNGADLNGDFDANSYFFRFVNSQIANISIPTYRDADTSEGTESFSVNVVSGTIPSGVELDSGHASTVVNILNFVEPVITQHPDQDTLSLMGASTSSPNVTDFPSSRFNVRAATSFFLSCGTNSLNNTITWHLDGSASPLPTEGSSTFSIARTRTLSTLTVNTASQLANGAYHCRASLSTEVVVSREVFIAIENPSPSLSTSTNVLYLDPPAPLDIVIQSFGTYSYIQWYYNGTNEVTRNDSPFALMRFDHVLRLGVNTTISPVFYKGEYIAMMISGSTTIASVLITVDAPEFSFNVTEVEARDPLTYGTGEALNLTCSARATHSATFSWREPTTTSSAAPSAGKDGGSSATTTGDGLMGLSAEVDLYVPGERAQSGLYCCVGSAVVGSATVDAEECLNITIVDPLSLNNPSYTVLTPPEALNLSATVNFNVIQSVVWRRDGQVVNSVDNSVGVFARLSTADLFGNYTVTAISRQGVVYEEWALVAAYVPVSISPVQSVVVVELQDGTLTSTSLRCIYTGHPKPAVSVWVGPDMRPYSSAMYQDVTLFRGNGTAPYVGQSELTLDLSTPGQFNVTCGAMIIDSSIIGSPIADFATITVLAIDHPNPCESAGCSHRCFPLNATSAQCSCPSGLYLIEDGKTCVVTNPVLTPSALSVTAVTGDEPVTLSCAPSGIAPSQSAVRWRVNGSQLTVEEGDNRMIFSDELATNLVFTLVEPAISGVYTCELVEYPSVSANISVLVEEGCYADAFVPNVRVGEAVNVSCSEAHPSFNPLGVVQWQCIGHLQWQGDLSACTFKEEAQNPIALLSYQLPSLQVADAVMMKSDLLSAFESYVRETLGEYDDIEVVNISIPFIGRLETAGSSHFLLVLELSNTSKLQRLSILIPNLEGSTLTVGSYKVIPPRSGLTALVPTDQCDCPILTTDFFEGRNSPQVVTRDLCRARSYVVSPCTCVQSEKSKQCQCAGVFISMNFPDIGTLCVQDTDGDRIPNTVDPCEACCLNEVNSGLFWSDTPANTTALLPCSDLSPTFNSLSYVKRFCNAQTGLWEGVDNRGCTFKPEAEDAVVIFQGILNEESLSSLPTETSLEENILIELQAEFQSFMPKNITVKVYMQSRAPTTTIPPSSSPPPDRKRAAVSNTPASATVTAFMLFAANVSSDVLFVFGDSRSKRDSLHLDRQQRNVLGIYFEQTMLFGHRPAAECSCDVYFRPGATTFYETCVGPSGDPCACSFVDPEAPPNCMCEDPYAPVSRNDDDLRSKRVSSIFCAPDRDGDRIADVEDSCPDLYDPTNECSPPSAETLELVGSCPDEVDPMWAISWTAVPLNMTNTQRCPGEVGLITGVATRRCGLDGVWEDPDVSGCESLGFRTVRVTTLESNSALDSNPAVQESGSTQVEVQPAQLAVITTNTLFLCAATEPTGRPLFPQDLNTTVTFLAVVSSFAEQTTLFSDPAYSEEELFEIVDNIIDSTQADGWEQLAEDQSRDSSPLLLQSMETISAQFADNLDTNALAERMDSGQLEARVEGRNSIISAKQVEPPEGEDVLEIEVESGSTFASSGLIPAITLPTALLRDRASARGTSYVPVVIVVMDNLQNFLPLRFYNNTFPQNTSVGTLLLSTQVSQSRGYSPVLVESPVTMEFPSQYPNQPSTCVFWSFEAENENISLDLGGWSDTNVTTGQQQRESSKNVTCSSTHLTTFAVLVDVSGLINQLPPEEALAFSIVSYIGCSISLICLIATVIFLISLRKDLFKVVVNYVHLNLSISLICGLIVFLAGIQGATSSRGGCAFVAFLLHYFFLAAFSWMLCEGVVLYNLLVKVFRANDRKWLYVYSALGWGIPAPFVIIAIAARSSFYRIPKSYDTTSPLYSEIRACWLPHEQGLIAAFIIPMLAIIAVNCVFVGITLRSVYKFKKSQYDRTKEEFTKKEAGFTLLKAFMIILPLLGLTWVIGLLAVNPYTTVFAWIFLFLNAFQGMFIFFFHVVRHEKVWPVLTSKCRGKKKYTVSTSGSVKTTSTFKGKRTSATMKAAVLDFREQEEKEMQFVSIKNSCICDDESSAATTEVVRATEQTIEEYDGKAEEDTPLN